MVSSLSKHSDSQSVDDVECIGMKNIDLSTFLPCWASSVGIQHDGEKMAKDSFMETLVFVSTEHQSCEKESKFLFPMFPYRHLSSKLSRDYTYSSISNLE